MASGLGRDQGEELELIGLSEDEFEADDFNEITTSEAGQPSRPPRHTPCPYCEKPIPKGRHRCPACGRSVAALVSDSERREHKTYRGKVRAGIALAVLVAAAALLLGALVSRNASVPESQRDYLRGSSFVGFAKLFENLEGSRRDSAWSEKRGRYVRWVGVITDQGSGGLFGEPWLQLRDPANKVDGEILVTLSAEEARKPALGERVLISGRLVHQGTSPLFELEDGAVLQVLSKH